LADKEAKSQRRGEETPLRTATRLVVAACLGAIITVAPATAADDPKDPRADAPVVAITVTPVRPYRTGDFVWLTNPPPPSGASTMDVGCDRVPATGFIGTNVYAESGAHYANYWNWGQGSSSEPYYWYVKRTDDTTQTWGYLSSGGNSSVPANVYRWKVQNKGVAPQAWQVCYEVV
jgi:hypothetical protein